MKRMGRVMLAIGLAFFAQAAQADWTPSKRLTWTAGGSGNPAALVDDAGHLHVFWEDDTLGDSEIFHKKSLDGGTTWSPAQRLTWTLGQSTRPAVAVDNFGPIYLVWQDEVSGNFEIYFKLSTDGGSTWSARKRLSWSSGDSQNIAISVDAADSLHVVWEDLTPGNAEIFHRVSRDGGITWEPVQRLTWASGGSVLPVITGDSYFRAHVIWQDAAPGNDEIYYKSSTDGGATWSPNQRLTWTSKGSNAPSVTVYFDQIFIVWYDYTFGLSEIAFKKSTDGGSTWWLDKWLTSTSNFSYDPTIVVGSPGVLHVIWEYYTPGYDDLYYKSSSDWGTTWTASRRLTFTPGDSWYPDVVSASGDLHLFWSDDTPGNYEIYYKQFIK